MNPDDKLPDTGRDWLDAAVRGDIREIRGVDDDLRCLLTDGTVDAIDDPVSSRKVIEAIQGLVAAG